MDVSATVGELRALASTSVAEALEQAEILRTSNGGDPDLLYLLAELHARSGRPHEALDRIVEAQALYRRDGRHLDAERSEIGRIAVLDDLGRHDDAVRLAAALLSRLGQLSPTSDIIELEVRVLGNRAFCFESLGRFADAAHDYEVAVAKARHLGDELLVARLQVNGANVLDLLGRTQDSLAGLRLASATLDTLGERDDRVTVATHIGRTLCRRGEYDEGLQWFHRAEQLVEPGTDDECDISVESADALAGLGAIDEALARYRSATEMLASRPLSWLEGRAWLGVGLCLARQGRNDSAREALLASIEAFQADDNMLSKMTALLELATLEGENRETIQFAVDEARRVLALADVESTPFHACVAHLKLAEFASGAVSERHLRAALRLAHRVGLAPLSMRVEQRLGRLLLDHRRTWEAAPHVRAAATYAETLIGRIGHRSLLRSFPTETSSCFNDLVVLLLREGDVPGAFAAADRARSRSLIELSVDRTPRSFARDRSPEEAELHAIYDRLLGVSERTASAARLELERRARELEAGLDRSDFDLASGPARSVAFDEHGAESDQLPTFTLLYLERDEAFDLLVRDASGRVEHHPSVGRRGVVENALARFHAEGRCELALRSARTAAHSSRPDRTLSVLGGDLLRPVAERIVGAGVDGALPSVLVLPAGCLHAVPFSALGCGSERLIDHAVVTVSASASMHASCSRRSPRSNRVAIVGVSGAAIPGVIDEVTHLAGLIPAHLLVDDEATLEAVAAAARGARIVHLASHGMFRPDAPLRSGVRLADGWLTAAAAAEVDLGGALVVLSACDTGRATVADGEEVLGLQYGFFAAGASSVVMSLWPAHDASTARLMRTLYSQLAEGSSPAVALRVAQLALRASEPHPWWWSSFVSSGAF